MQVNFFFFFLFSALEWFGVFQDGTSQTFRSPPSNDDGSGDDETYLSLVSENYQDPVLSSRTTKVR